MELVYLWVEDYKNINKQGFNFSPKFECKYDEKNNKFTINENKDYKSIFPPNINVTAIVGENGSGKSSLIKYFIKGINHHTISYDIGRKLACYLNHEQNLLYIHTYIPELNVQSIFPSKIEITQKSFYDYKHGFEKEKFESFYYIYQPNIDIENDIYDCFEYNEHIIKFQEPKKQDSILNLSHINKKIHNYLLNYLLEKNSLSLYKNKPFFEPVGVYLETDSKIYDYLPQEYDVKYQEFQRKNEGNALLLVKLDMLIYFQYDYMDIKNTQPSFTGDIIKEIQPRINVTYNISIENINNLFSIIKAQVVNIITSLSNDRKKIKDNHNYSNDPLSLVLNEIENFFYTVNDLDYIFSICKEVSNNSYEINMSEFNHKIVTILQHIPNYFRLEFYENNGRLLEDLSSGEQNILKIIYSIQNIISLRKNKSKTINIFLDEVENTLHPNWQKQFINILIENFKYSELQINFYISSHSPFILSDLPKGNAIFLKDGKQDQPFKKDEQTFGANIHTLLSHGFFMDGGLMGEFAKSKITEVIEILKKSQLSEDEIKTCKHIISIIGEPILQKTLEHQLNEKLNPNETELQKLEREQKEIQKKIDELTKKKHETN